MLKIKDNVDLKELEKFGFKPKYNEDTGKLKNYTIFLQTNNDSRVIRIKINAEEYWEDVNDFFKPRKVNPLYKTLDIIGDMTSENSKNFAELLYDLIQAGLVEKIEEDIKE